MFILKMNEKWWLLVDMLDTVLYDEELFGWEIKSIDCYSIFDPFQLRYYCSLQKDFVIDLSQ
jgi:hypothetical protein